MATGSNTALIEEAEELQRRISGVTASQARLGEPSYQSETGISRQTSEKQMSSKQFFEFSVQWREKWDGGENYKERCHLQKSRVHQDWKKRQSKTLRKQEAVPLDRAEVLPCPEEKPPGCVLKLWVKLSGYSPILAVCDSGAEVALLSLRMYEQLRPQPELRPTNEIKGPYGPNHSPLGECIVKLEIPELVHYEICHTGTVEKRISCDSSYKNL